MKTKISIWLRAICVAAAAAWGLAAAGTADAAKISRNPYLGAIVVDVETGNVLYEDGADRPGYPASMLKLMDMYVLLEKISAGQMRADQPVAISKAAMDMGGSQVYLDPRESFKYTVEDLMYALMIQSANDAAVALAEAASGTRESFVAEMNATARELGLSGVTRFVTPHGLPPKTGRPDMTTPRDFSKLCVALLRKHPEVLKYTSETYRVFRPEPRLFEMRSHNPLLEGGTGGVPGCDGLKTGYFQDAGYSMALTMRAPNGGRIVAVMMGSETKDVRNREARRLLTQYVGEASAPGTRAKAEAEAAAAAAAAAQAQAQSDGAAAGAGEASGAEAGAGAAESAEEGGEKKGTSGWAIAGWTLLGLFVLGVAWRVVQRRILLQ